MFPISSKAWMKFEKEAVEQIKNQNTSPVEGPLYSVEYVFCMKGKGATDLDNMVAGVNDILEKCEIIDNDKNIHHMVCKKVVGEPEYKTWVKVQNLNES